MGGCRNGGQQLVARRLWCTDHQLGCLVWWLNPACSHERYTPKPLLSLHRKGQLAGCSLGYRLYFCVSKPLIRPSVTWSRNRLSSDQWILRHILKFQLRRAKRHAKRDRRCRPDNSGRLLTLLDWYQTVSNCSCWQTSIGQPVLFEYGTGCEWHPSNQTLQSPVVTIRCYPLFFIVITFCFGIQYTLQYHIYLIIYLMKVQM